MDINAFFKSIIDQETDHIVVCDLSHTVLYLNPKAQERYKDRLSIGDNLKKCHNQNSNNLIDKTVEWFSKSKENNIVFEAYSEKDNRDTYIVALRDETGNLIGYYEKHCYRDRETGKRYDFK